MLETRTIANLWNDDRKMDRYCHEYEVRMGVIRSPDRAAKYQAINEGSENEKTDGAAQGRMEAGFKPRLRQRRG